MSFSRDVARQLAREAVAAGDVRGWFDRLYARAEGDSSIVPWADMRPNPNLLEWLESKRMLGRGQRALVIGCGLGDDAEELARRGFRVEACDISPVAIAWCRRRFPESSVDYFAADLFADANAWVDKYDFVCEAYTLQVLPPEVRQSAMRVIAAAVAPGGTVLVITRGREESDAPGTMPWPLTRAELDEFEKKGLQQILFEDYLDRESPPVRRFRVEYRRP